MAASSVQDGEVLPTPPAEVVGNAFARQYYTILQQSPALVYRFYQDISRLGRPGDTGAMSSTTTMDAINAKIQSYGSLKADIKFVDAQESSNGGVIVLVTGYMINADESRRGFTQSFFLAPQDNGFFVLNDLFRYVENDFHQTEVQDSGVAPTTPPPNHEETLPVQENHIAEESNGETCDPHENGEVRVEKAEEEEEEEPVAEVVDEPPNDSEAVIESNAKIEDAPKKSYASVVMKDTPVSAPSPNLLKSMHKVQEQQFPPSSAPVAPPSGADMLDNGSNHESEGDGHSIYVRNLPVNVPHAVVEEAFMRFGTIKTGGVQVRNQKGFCFGFVEFEGAGAARSAIEASPITIAGREVVVEEKKSSSRGFNRGRFTSGRGGGGFRGEGGRGRGGYGGGRGYGRGENNRSDFENRGSGRGYQNRSEGYQRRSDQNGNAAGRVSRGGGSGVGNSRTQGLPGHD
ncbi:putative G3BP-like protein [Bienertia sinuspersici]